MTKLIGLCAFVALTFIGTGARAQSFGHSGDVSFAADRLMGIYVFTEDPDTVDTRSWGSERRPPRTRTRRHASASTAS